MCWIRRCCDPVAAVSVVGVPEAVRGEAIVAFVVAAPGAKVDGEALAAHCAERLAPYKCPQHILPLPELPMNFLGKVEKTRLRVVAEDALQAQEVER